MKTEREAFKAWVLKHPDNLNITSYEESIMFDSWQASAQREGYKLVPVEKVMDCLYQISDRSYVDDNVSELKAMIGSADE